jgi:hypothetical protein
MKINRYLRFLGSIFILLTVMPFSVHAEWNENRQSPVANQQIQLNDNTGSPNEIEISADSFGLPLSQDKIAGLYAKPSVFLQQNDSIQFKVVIPADGLYTVSFDMAASDTFINAPEGQLLVDGGFPSNDVRDFFLPIYYKNTTDTFPLDRYGNEALPRQERLILWSKAPMRDANFSQQYPLQLQLTQGEHRIGFKLNKESIYLGSIYLESFSKYPDYSQYLKDNPASDSSGVSILIEAEHSSYKNDTSIRPGSDRSLKVTPYDTYRLLLNTMGGASWQNSGSTVYYEFEVPADGMYCITLAALQKIGRASCRERV